MGLNMFLPTLEQRDRIQGMAQFMNSDGSSTEFMKLLYIIGGFLVLLLVLKVVGSKQESNSDKKSSNNKK
jgi:preprotein translocase subunit SecG